MGQETGISWTHATFNPVRGCDPVSPACDHCYAELLSKRNPAVLGKWGSETAGGTRVVAAEKYWLEPIKWNKQAAAEGVRKRVFCESLGDVFEDWTGPMLDHLGQQLFERDFGWSTTGTNALTIDGVLRRLFITIDATPWLDWLLLTKRPENIRRKWSFLDGDTTGRIREFMDEKESHDVSTLWRRNVWLGTTVENQEYANKRIPELLKCRDLVPVLFLSCEPLLGSVDLRNIQVPTESHKRGPDQPNDNLLDVLSGEVCSGETGCIVAEDQPTIDWVIAGGESKAKARPSHPDWFRSLRDQCNAAGVPFHFKQWGEWQDGSSPDDVPHAAVLSTGDYCTPDTRDARLALNHKVFGKWNELRPVCMSRVGVKKAGRLLDDMLHDAFPSVEVRS